MQHYKPLCKLSEAISVSKLSEAMILFALYSKNLQATHTWKFVTLLNHFLWMIYDFVKHFWDT